MRNMKTKKLHREDRNVVVNFINYARLQKPENVKLEVAARYVAEHVKVNPNMSNGRLANVFASLLESRKIA